jgi:hypothetical protein
MAEKIYRIKRVPNKRTGFLRDEILFKIAMFIVIACSTAIITLATLYTLVHLGLTPS